MSQVEPTWSIGWRGAVGGVVCLAATLGAGIAWASDPADPTDPVDRAVGDSSAAVASGAVTGEDLFQAKGCAGCHRGPGADDEYYHVAPDLDDAASWAGERRPGMSAEDYIAESIRQPGAFTSPAFRHDGNPVDAMPSLEVSAAEIDAITSYLLQQPED